MPVESPFYDTKPFFFGVSSAVFLSGFVIGVRKVMKKENTKFSLLEHGRAGRVAGKALLYGTVLCFGYCFLDISNEVPL